MRERQGAWAWALLVLFWLWFFFCVSLLPVNLPGEAALSEDELQALDEMQQIQP